MALPPTIPTSFVPKQAVVARKSVSGFNPFLMVSYIIFFVWVVVGILVFSYQWYLTKTSEQKKAALVTAQNNIDQASLTDFIRLRDRFTISKETLDKHVTLSQFFDKIEGITIQNAHFTNLKLTVLDNRTAKLEMTGTARNFNALAAQSSAFTTDKDIRKAIFSGFVIDPKDGSVTFQITAEVEPSLITQLASAVQPVAVPDTSVPVPPAKQATTTKP
jgi:hypothetical protein